MKLHLQQKADILHQPSSTTGRNRKKYRAYLSYATKTIIRLMKDSKSRENLLTTHAAFCEEKQFRSKKKCYTDFNDINLLNLPVCIYSDPYSSNRPTLMHL
jgi:hypothetical protein